MKLSTANLSQALQNIKPMKRLSNKLKQAVGQRSKPKNSVGKGAIASQPAIAEDLSRNNGKINLEAKASSEAKAESSPHISSSAKANSTKANSAKTSGIVGFVQNSKLVQSSKSARVAFHLLLVKPWVLVVGLWLVSALSAVVAIEGLINPSKLTEDLPEPAAEVAPVAKANSFIDVEQGAEGITDDGKEIEKSEPDASEAIAANAQFPVWPLVTLVGSCAAGCVVISRRRAMLRIAAARTRNRGRKLQSAKPQIAKLQSAKLQSAKLQSAKPQIAPTRLKASNHNPTRRSPSAPRVLTPVTALKSKARLAVGKAGDKNKEKARDKAIEKTVSTTLGKKRRQRKRSSSHQAAAKPAGKSRVLISRSTAQQAAPQSKVSQPGSSPRARQKVTRLVRRQPVVSVVPAEHANRLDWAEGSLAHDLDKRVSM